MVSPESPRAVRLLVLALLAVTFTAGGLAGAAVVRVLSAQEADAPAAPASDEPCRERRGRILDQIDLSQAQRAEIDRVLERRRAQIDAFWQDAGPELEMITDSTRAEIRAVLTPDQRTEYDRLRAERKAAREKREKHEDDR